MKFPDHITGPRFDEGDIVSFIFDDATLTMKIPKIPCGRNTKDQVCTQTNFKDADTGSWEHFGVEGQCFKAIVKQTWKYEDEVTHDDIAHVYMEVGVQKHSLNKPLNMFGLQSAQFVKFYLDEISNAYQGQEVDKSPSWPSDENNFFARIVQRERVDGLQVQLDLGGGEKYPVPTAYFSLGNCYSLIISFHFGSLHYPDRKNPFSEDLLQQFKADLFEDLLSHIHIEYTPEAIALIEQLKQQNES